MIGHAMENVYPCQLQTYMALLYNMVSLDDIISNDENKNLYKQNLVLANGKQIINNLPSIKAPVSAVQFWIEQLKLTENELIKSFSYGGYSSVTELVAELKGFYKFYTQARYDNYYIIMILMSYHGHIIIKLQFFLVFFLFFFFITDIYQFRTEKMKYQYSMKMMMIIKLIIK